MNEHTILVIGSGGREHALAWKLAQSPRVQRVIVAPGNGGIAQAGGKISAAALPEDDAARLIAFARAEGVTLTVVGPEAPLAAGLVDAFTAAGLRCFGPSAAAARLEASKAFAKDFMAQHAIPTARYAVFSDFTAAQQHLRAVPYPVVIKASGLAAGKGVIVPASPTEAEQALAQMLLTQEFGAAGAQVVIEERLSGPEVSVLAFCDGRHLAVMPAAQDHKRVYDDDQGPNTGGMGAYAPAPLLTPALQAEVARTILQPTLDGLAAAGTPYVGVLYAGLMLTVDGPSTLEFNCRFGDPETQVLLPLLASDLVDVIEACLDGQLDPDRVQWKAGAAATVVAASAGYPAAYPKGHPISGLAEAAALPAVQVFYAGIGAADNGELVTNGGRVLAVTGTGADLPAALGRAYAGLDQVQFAGMHYRRDIGAQAAAHPQPTAYQQAGVDIGAGSRAVALMRDAVRATYGPEVLQGIGAFGGLFDAAALRGLAAPVLVASTDGVGTKTKIASALHRYDTIGHDIVNHCINDILVQGARPLFFLDYIASSRLDPAMIAAVVSGAAAACAAAGCALLGGETAEMPGVYAGGEFDLVGTMVGVVDRAELIDGTGIVPGDVVIGLPSSGLHTNGYSLVRRVFADWELTAVVPALGQPLGEALLAPHRSYLPAVQALRAAGVTIKGLAHITGGGLVDNPPRILPPGTCLHLWPGSWPVPPLFDLIQRTGGISDAEMAHVFNLGLGMLVVLSPEQAELALQRLGEGWRVGEIRTAGGC